MGPLIADRSRRRECLQLIPGLGDDVLVTTKRRALIPMLTLALALTACGGDGVSQEDREELVQMLERLGNGRILAQCVADEFEGVYEAADMQQMIDARNDFSTVDFLLIEDYVKAQKACAPDTEPGS